MTFLCPRVLGCSTGHSGPFAQTIPMGKFGTGACWTAVRSNRPVTFVAIAAWTALAAHSGMDQVHSGMDHLYGFHIICFMGGASMKLL